MRQIPRLFVVCLLTGVLAATVLSCNQGADRMPSGPTAVDPAWPAATTPLASSNANPNTSTKNSTVSWACVTAEAGRSAPLSGGWTIQGDRCPSTLHRNSTATETAAPIFAPAPTNLRATVTGTTVQLNWDQAPVAFAWQLEAGSGPGLSNIAVFRTTAGTSLTVTGVPPGTYHVRVRSAPPDFSDLSVPSNEIIVIVGSVCTGPPQPPTDFNASVIGSQVTLSWNQPSGQTATSYVLEVGSAPGSITFPIIDTGNASTTLQATAPNGEYYLRTRARNACGTSGPSNEILVLVGVPLPPAPVARMYIPGFMGVDTNSCIRTCTFNGTRSTGTDLMYHWDFGDGTTDTGPIVVHDYGPRPPGGGAFKSVRLRVIDRFGRTSVDLRLITIFEHY